MGDDIRNLISDISVGYVLKKSDIDAIHNLFTVIQDYIINCVYTGVLGSSIAYHIAFKNKKTKNKV